MKISIELKKSYYEVCMDLIQCSTQMIIGYVCIDMIAAISLHYLSNHGSNIQVAGFGLANLLTQVFLIPFGFGLNQSLNQQVSQAQGHSASKLPFIILNFTIYQHVLYFVPVGFLLYCCKDLFRYLISENVDQTLDFAWQALPLVILGWMIASEFEAFKIFLLPKKVFTPFVVIHFVTLLGHIMWCHIFIQTFENKVYAVCTSIIITEISNNILFYIYINKTGLISHFKGLQFNFIMIEKFQLYKSFIKITIPQVFHIYATTVGFLALTLISIRLGTDAFNAQLALSQTSGTYFRVPFTISIAMMSFIGQQLGQGNIINAKNYFKFGLYIYFLLVVVSLFLFYGYKDQWAEFFSANETVSTLMLESLTSFLIGFVFFDGLQMIIAGGLKGLNHGYVVSHQTIICYIIIGTPLETYFAYNWQKGIQGIWVGFGIVNAILLLLFLQTLQQISWEKQAKEIQDHTQDQIEKADLELVDLKEQNLLSNMS